MTQPSHSNIVLCGLPGAGKTSVGMRLAGLLNREFIDTDRLIEEKCGVSCREYFRAYGESAFRALEKEIIVSLQSKTSVIIALGGGTIEIHEVLEMIPSLGIIVHLMEDIDELIQRKIIHDRPATATDEESYRLLVSRRLPLFKKIANIEIHSKNKHSNEISREVIEKVRRQYGE